MRLIPIISAVIILLVGQNSYAASCGFPPKHNISIPNGASTTREVIQTTVREVESFSQIMQTYLDCLDTERETMMLHMNKDQQQRWNEDYDANLEVLSTIQTGLNEQIRVFNNQNE